MTDYARDRIELQDVMLNYTAAVDERNFERYRACFADDVEVVGFGTQTFRGIEDWVTYVMNALEKYSSTQHMLGPQFATIEGDQAQTRSDVQAVNFLANGNLSFTLWATYKTTMRRIQGRWLITRHELTICGTSVN
jgi:hypothetical protein